MVQNHFEKSFIKMSYKKMIGTTVKYNKLQITKQFKKLLN